MYTIHAIAAVRMCCRMFCSQAYPYGRAHSSCLCFVDVYSVTVQHRLLCAWKPVQAPGLLFYLFG